MLKALSPVGDVAPIPGTMSGDLESGQRCKSFHGKAVAQLTTRWRQPCPKHTANQTNTKTF